MSIIERAVDKIGGRDDKKGTDEQQDAFKDEAPLAVLEELPAPIFEEDAPEPMAADPVESDPTLPPVSDADKTNPRMDSRISKSSKYLRLNLERLKNVGMLTPDASKTQLAEEYRLIKRPILANAFGKVAHRPQRANLVMVASSVPGEGKTFNAINLAMSAATELDRTVLLIDADVLKPAVTRLLGIEAEKGLIDVLAEPDVALSDVMIKTDIPRLSILPAGRTHSHSTELLASEAMTELCNELSERYPDRLVIFDSPPLLATTEAVVLAELMGQIALVVAAETTPRPTVNQTLDLFSEDKVVGLILNKNRQAARHEYYGYGSYGQAERVDP